MEYFAHWCQYVRHDLKIPFSEEICLVMDSGGGSLSHFAPEVGVLSAKYRVRPFYLAPYHTAALMPLDQSPNREFERCWSQIRSKESNFNSLQALNACHECFDHGYSKKNVLQGWSSIGLAAGESVCRDKVILERGPQLFRQVVPKEERDYVCDVADQVFSPPKGYKRARESARCSSSQCRGIVQSSHKFCPACGQKNESYNAISDAVDQGARAQGYRRKSTALVDMQDALDFEPATKRHLTKVWGDMLSKVRTGGSGTCEDAAETGATSAGGACQKVPTASASGQKVPAPSTPAASAPCKTPAASASGRKVPAPSTPAASAPCKTPAASGSGRKVPAPSTPAAPAPDHKSQGEGADSASEESQPNFDLDSPEDAQKFLEAYWSRHRRAEVRPVLEFFLSQLRKEVSKKKPLSELIRLRVTQTGVLKSREGKKKFIQAWAENRSKRFAEHPRKK